MRIITGKYRGKKIKYLNSLITRPLRDIVRENIFNLISHGKNINVNIEKSNVLDLYAGVGSFGIECISRNANKVVFVEKNQIAFSILKENVASLKFKENVRLVPSDVNFFLKKNKHFLKFDIIFFDPPYKDDEFVNCIKTLKDLNIVNKNHLIIIHREKKTKDNLKELMNILLLKKYGRSQLIFGSF